MRFRPLFRWLLAFALLTPALPAAADVLVLIHGYRSDAGTWLRHGVLAGLVQRGWRDGGVYALTPGGPHHFGPKADGDRVVVAVDLPSEAPIPLQSRVLYDLLTEIARRHEGEPLILVGHSAGGVVARHAVVTHPELPVRAVITLASPHLGSEMAKLAALASRTPPVEAMAPLMGVDTINRSSDLYHDLRPERPGNFLFWLNRQPHPDQVVWISLVRRERGAGRFFELAAPWRQDLRNVVALGPRARSWLVPGGHELRPADGWLIADVVARELATGGERRSDSE